MGTPIRVRTGVGSDSPDGPAPGRRGRRLRSGCFAVVAALTVAGCSGSGEDGPSSPQAAAQAWADAGLHHDQPAQRALTCAAGSSGDDMLGLLTYATKAYKAGSAQPDGPLSWTVPVQAIQLDGDQVALTFHVVREHDRYLVC